MPSMVTLKTGLWIKPEEAEKLKSRLTRVRGVIRVDVPYPDRLVITYESPRVRLSTLKAVVGGMEARNFRVTRT